MSRNNWLSDADVAEIIRQPEFDDESGNSGNESDTESTSASAPQNLDDDSDSANLHVDDTDVVNEDLSDNQSVNDNQSNNYDDLIDPAFPFRFDPKALKWKPCTPKYEPKPQEFTVHNAGYQSVLTDANREIDFFEELFDNTLVTMIVNESNDFYTTVSGGTQNIPGYLKRWTALTVGGFNYYGTERMYSGVNGREMKASIFFGIVHYQRLRHMVADKWQARSTGPIDVLTRQPIKGRKRGGGVRFGEMERDSLLSHGAAYLLQDRLFLNSDRTTVIICSKCGSLYGPVISRSEIINNHSEIQIKCSLCKDSSHIRNLQVPYILKYLIAELSSVNIYIHLKTSDIYKAV